MEGGPLDEEYPSPTTLSREQAVRLALESDPALQASLARVLVAQAAAEEAGLLPNPVLDVVLRFAEGGALHPEIGLTADLVGAIQRPRKRSAAENRLRAEAASALGTALDVLYEVQARYSAVQVLEELGDVLAERLGLVEELRAVAQARLDAGEGKRTDLEAFEVEQMAIEIEAAGAASELRRERLALARLIGQPSRPADWRVDEWRPWQGGLSVEPAWIETALARNPEVQAARWELAARQDELALSSTSALEGARVGAVAERDGDWSAGPVLSVPLPLSGRSRLRREHALASEAESRHRLNLVERRAVEEVRAAFTTLRSSRENLDRLRDELIPLLERRRSDVERAYQAREVDVTLLLLADQALLSARARAVDLERTVSASLYGLERVAGGPAAFDLAVAIQGSTSTTPSKE